VFPLHKEAIADPTSAGKRVMESVVKHKAVTLLDFLHGLQG
jgi:hypothetical protein